MASIARRLSFMGQVDPDVALWRDSIIGAGGSVSIAALSIASRFVAAEKSSGAWALTDDYWPFWGENLTQSTISLKQRRTVTLQNLPIHVPRRHFSTNGTTSYLDTGFIPSSHRVAALSTNVRLAVYVRNNPSSNAFAAGAVSSSNRNLRIRPRDSGLARLEASTSAGAYTLPVNTGLGYTVASRDASAGANCYGYKNGQAMAQSAAPANFGSTLPLVPIFVGGFNNSGVFSFPAAVLVGFMAFGATLSAAQELAHYNAVQEWAIAIGANV